MQHNISMIFQITHEHTCFTGTDFDYSHGSDYGYEADLHIAKLQEYELILT